MVEKQHMIEVLFQNNNWIFVNKPSGLIVHRSSATREAPALMQLLRDQIGMKVYPIHRLDGGTSGVIGLGLSSESAKQLQECLADSKTQKQYYALVRGHTREIFTVDKPLKDENKRPQSARTDFKTIASCEYCSLVEATLHTGRTHQIRRHLSHLSHHVLGDRTYGKRGLNEFYLEKYGLSRLFLHAFSLNLFVKERGEYLNVYAPMPNDLLKVIHQLCDEGLFKMDSLPASLRPGA